MGDYLSCSSSSNGPFPFKIMLNTGHMDYIVLIPISNIKMNDHVIVTENREFNDPRFRASRLIERAFFRRKRKTTKRYSQKDP